MKFITIIAILWAAAACPSAFGKDFYLKQQVHADESTVMGQTQPARDFVREVWLTPNRMVIFDDESKTVVDWEKKLIATADHRRRTIVQMPLNRGTGIAAMSAEERRRFEKVMGEVLDLRVVVKVTDERRAVAGRACRKYLLTVETGMDKTTAEIWASPELNVDKEMTAAYIAFSVMQMPGAVQAFDATLAELKKIEGLPVLTVQRIEMMGQTFARSAELLEFREAKAPQEAFEMPHGYVRQTL